MEIINNGIGPAENEGYNRVDKFDDQKTEELTGLYKQVLDTLGEDVGREGLDQTPLRVAKSMQFLTQGYGSDPNQIISQAMFKEDYSEMVIVKDIDVFSLCEHHLIPFIGKAHVAYIPNGYITGLSKIARVVEAYS
jgi:GTP cyclohydrolase I